MSSGKWRPFCLGLNVLTNITLDKLATISQKVYSDVFLWMKKICILIKIWLKFVPMGGTGNNPEIG